MEDTYVRRKKNIDDELFVKLNNYHENINFTIEKNPQKFLDTKISIINNTMHTDVVFNEYKLPPHWNSKIPKRFKRNIINGDLHRAKKIASDFQNELIKIRLKYKNAGYPIRYINSVISSFNNNNNTGRNISSDKIRITINLPYCPENEEYSKTFINRLNIFTENKYSFFIMWKTRKIRSLFPLKDKVKIIHKSDIIYEGSCSCGEIYVGQTDRNAILRWDEHDDYRKSSEPAKHLKENRNHHFNWKILSNASNFFQKRKILETYFIKLIKPSLNNQHDNYQLKLYHNGVT